MADNLTAAIAALIKEASTNLPADVFNAITHAENKETNKTAKNVLNVILDNIKLAKRNSVPICQDTGSLNFYVKIPLRQSHKKIKQSIINAVKTATREYYLRPNAVDSITGRNSGDNTGEGFPSIKIGQWNKPEIMIDLLLKGGGSENVSSQYELPNAELNAGRDLDGIKRCVIDAVFKAQGRGCAPGIIGVCIGGTRDNGYAKAKKQFLRNLNDKNNNKRLLKIEKELFIELNKLGIGPMGLGGRTTVLGVKLCSLHRVPASFFVTISYMCWALRRKRLIYKKNKWKIK